MEEMFISQEQQEEYAFLEMRFFPNKWQIELRETENPISLTKIQREFLLILVKNAKQLVSYDDLRLAVWSHEPKVDQRLIHNMHVTKSKLTGLFDARGVDSSFIESIDGTGYRLNVEVAFYPARHPVPDSDSGHVFNRNTVVMTANTPTAYSTSFFESAPQIEKPNLNSKLILGAIAAAIMIVLIWQPSFIFRPDSRKSAISNFPSEEENESRQIKEDVTDRKNTAVLRLEKSEFISQPVPGNEFFLHLKGKNLNPETVRLKVTGPGCGGDAPCTVPNGALRLYGQITEMEIEKAPVTLARGEYYLWLENEPGNTSNKLPIIVPAANR